MIRSLPFKSRRAFKTEAGLLCNMVIPAALYEFRDQNRNLLVRTTSLCFENVLHNRR